MNPSCEAVEAHPLDVDALVRAVPSDPGSLEAAGLDALQCARQGFAGKLGQVLVERPPQGAGALHVAVGIGERAAVGRDVARRAAAAAVRALPGCESLSFDLAGYEEAGLDGDLAARSCVEGALLCLERFDAYRSRPEPSKGPSRLFVVRAGGRAAVEAGRAVAEAVIFARRLVNTPASDLTPAVLAEEAVALGEREALEVRVFNEDDARSEGLGGLLAVARGSAEPPRLVRVAYRPDGEPVGRVALVGKGITFDSGGLSLKTATSMATMKTDMAGAAAVLATLGACRRLAVRAEVVGFLALSENMPGARAQKPGDVFTARNGTTVEVLNTDAEGRLVLADALSLAAEEEPDAIVDLATLTGACVVALGRGVAGLLGNDDRLVADLSEAGRQAGEPSWRLPLPPSYASLLDSDVADVANIGPNGQAGAVLGGLFLERFVGDRPWAHLDIAGPARSEEDADYRHKGGTGFGVRTLCELLEHFEPRVGPAFAAAASKALPA
jgi:leucyl aminopeptidase